MKNVLGVWLPDHEKHLVDEFATGPNWTYQKNKLDAAMEYCIPRRVAVDIGGHCGLWSRHLTKLFETVIAFEPKQEHRECYTMNVDGNYTLYPFGLDPGKLISFFFRFSNFVFSEISAIIFCEIIR